jgi:serine/threonine-protein kinase
MPTDPRAEQRVGSVLHEKWTLERLLGVGGMGAVYAARHRNGARAAVKVLSPQSGRLPHIRDRFLREGYAANRVEHPGAVKVLDDDVIQDGEDEGTAYLVMELLEGESLQDRAKREPPLGERDLLEVADGVLAVLDAAHANGVVHRDLKPDNLFLARDAERKFTQIKVLDFGLARLLEAQEQTIAGMALGTPTYMSPEQAAGHVDQIDGRTDIYALGSILFQLVSNKRIHDALHTLGLVVRMATMPAPKLRTVAPEVSEGFAKIVDRALEFRREDRYSTAAEMRAAVKAALATRAGVEASTLNVIPASVEPGEPSEVATAPTVAAPVAPAALVEARSTEVGASQEPPVGRDTNAEARETSAAPKRRARSHASLPPAPGSWRGWLVLVTLVALVGFVAWRNWEALERLVASPAPPPSTAPASAAASTSAPPLDAAVDVVDASDALDAASFDDASASSSDPDAALDDASDASVDGGLDDEEDDEEDELDGGSDASAPLPRGGTVTPPRRPHVPGAAARPPTKHRAPKRPGHPRRKKRWHW